MLKNCLKIGIGMLLVFISGCSNNFDKYSSDVFSTWQRGSYNFDVHDKKILKIKDKKTGATIASRLAMFDHNWYTNDKEILMLSDNEGFSVAYYLAKNNPNWTTQDEDILMLQDKKYHISVAHILAKNHKNWTTKNPKILELQDKYGKTVAKQLKESKKITHK